MRLRAGVARRLVDDMGKLFLTLVLAVVAWLLGRALLRKAGDGGRHGAGAASQAERHERMLPCSRCGVYLPESETRQIDGAVTCLTPEQCARRERA